MQFMKPSLVLLSLFILVLFACNSKQEQQVIEKAMQRDIPVPVTILAELPDSLQPKTYVLEKMPKPAKTLAPPLSGIRKKIPVLRNEKDEPILESLAVSDGGKPHFTHFTSDDGLASDQIICSTMDKNGNLWFGTSNGLSRYDGKTFTTFTPVQGIAASVYCILADKKGNIWFGRSGGLSRYDGKTFSNFTTAQGLTSQFVTSIFEDKKGNLWFGTSGAGISRYDGKIFTTFTTAQGTLNDFVSKILEDKKGNLWFGTTKGLSHYDGKTFTTFTTAQGLASDFVSSILEDKNGNLWFGTFGGGLSRYDGKTFSNFTTDQGLASDFVTNILEDKKGNLWFGTTKGLSRYDGKIFTTFTTAQGTVNDVVFKILEDKKGNLWFGGTKGLSRYDGKIFTTFTTDQGLEDINDILEDKNGNIWFGGTEGLSRYDGTCTNFTAAQTLVGGITEDKNENLWFLNGLGVSRYDGKTLTRFITIQDLGAVVVSSISADKNGNLWFGSFDDGVIRYDGKTFTNFTTAQGLADSDIRSISADNSGNLWFGTYGGGVSRFDGKTFTNFTPAQGLADSTVIDIFEDKAGNLWFGTAGGVSRYDGKTFTNFTPAQGLADSIVNDIFEDKAGNLWFCIEGGGLSVMDAQKLKGFLGKTGKARKKAGIASPLIKNFTVADDLPDDQITSVIQLPNGKMAVGSHLGITLFNVSKDYSKLQDIETYNTRTGYPIKEINNGINSNSMILDSKGNIWAGTQSKKTALVRFNVAAIPQSKEAPALFIQNIKIKDQNICWYDLQSKGVRKNKQDSATALLQEFLAYGRPLSSSQTNSILKRFGNIRFDDISKFYPLPVNLVLPYEHNQIAFEFVAVETGRPLLVKYQYMLEGYDKGWSQITDKSNATFGNMAEGMYTFKLKARGANGIWTKPVTYTFKVLPPWYRSWGAYIGYFSLVVMAILTVISWRTRSLQKEKALLEEKVAERTTELKKSLTQLKSTQAQLIQSEKLASLGELTAGIAHEIQNPLNFVNNFAEVSAEMLDDMKADLHAGKTAEAVEIADDLKVNLQKINHHGQRASAIVKGMLEHSRTGDAIHRVSTDINALADEYLRLAYHGLRARDSNFYAAMETHFDPDLPLVSVIPQDIGRVLLNLINNAFYAVAERSRSTVHQRATDVETLHATSLQQHPAYQPTVIISTQKTGDQIIIKVQDNGNGIPESIRDKIFQPFFTTKPTGQGTGLGLSLAYDIVTKGHGGTLEVESTEGIGSAFSIKLSVV
jgi:ligand-binding sensor domain-containing protein/signal transduction histidine kinase